MYATDMTYTVIYRSLPAKQKILSELVIHVNLWFWKPFFFSLYETAIILKRDFVEKNILPFTVVNVYRYYLFYSFSKKNNKRR